MYAKAFTLAILSTTAVAQFMKPVHYDFGAMLKRGEAIAKRQGYYPSTEPCGSGDTCEVACGAGQVQCASNSGLYCYDPKVGHCCPDKSGYSCDNGYFCTTDGSDNTYCCPDGMNLADCAAAYSLTVSLIRETGSVAPSSGSVAPSASSVPASTTPIHITYPTATATVAPTGNATYSTGAPPPEFTGAAARAAGAGMAVLAGAAGIAGLL